MKTTGYRNLVAVVATLALVTSDVYGGYVVPLSKLGINAPIERREGPFATHEEAAEWARNWIRSLPPNEYKTYSIIETDDGIAADVAERITGINAGLKQIRETARNSGVATEIPAAGNVTAGYAGAVEIAYGNAKAAQDALTELAEDAPEDLLQSANRLIQEMTASETESYLLEQERHLQQLATDVASTIAESSSARLNKLVVSLTEETDPVERARLQSDFLALVQAGEVGQAAASEVARVEADAALQEIEDRFDALKASQTKLKDDYESIVERIRNPSPLINTAWCRMYDSGVDRFMDAYVIKPDGKLLVLEQHSVWGADNQAFTGKAGIPKAQMIKSLHPHDEAPDRWEIRNGEMLFFVQSQYGEEKKTYRSTYKPVLSGGYLLVYRCNEEGKVTGGEPKKFERFTYSK